MRAGLAAARGLERDGLRKLLILPVISGARFIWI